MFPIVIVFLGAAFTVLSLCILLAVSFVFARSDRPFVTDRRPWFFGLAGAFALVLLAAGALLLGVGARHRADGPFAPTTGIESKLATLAAAKKPAHESRQAGGFMRVSLPAALPVQGRLPSFDGATTWLNSAPLSREALRGKVVVVNFWTFSCINSLRALPYLKTWEQRYHDAGLVVLGVQTPEFGFEHETDNVKRALSDLNIHYPVAIDNDYAIWQAFGNQYGPRCNIGDTKGRIRYQHFVEGGFAEADQAIRQLLAENGHTVPESSQQVVQASGAEAAADLADVGSGETYVGYREAQGFASPQRVKPDAAVDYTLPARLSLNTWALGGQWNVGAESGVATAQEGRIAYRFHARDLHLVLGPSADGKPVRFRITIDGAPPGAAHGADVASDGTGTVTSARLYQLVRQPGPVHDHTFEIEFLDPGVKAYSFTFG